MVSIWPKKEEFGGKTDCTSSGSTRSCRSQDAYTGENVGSVDSTIATSTGDGSVTSLELTTGICTEYALTADISPYGSATAPLEGQTL